MSHINELIEQLCPEGVPCVALEKLCMKTSNIKWKDAGAAEYSYIDLTSVDISLRRITDTTSISANNAPSRAQQIVQAGDVIFATTRPTQMRVCVIPQEYDGQVCSTGFCVLRPSQSITTNYLMHALGTADFCKYLEDNQTMGNYPAISNKKLLKYRIPVPPIEVQQEIVNVLDSFAKLETELETELEARQCQFDYYRSRVLSSVEFEELVTLGSICSRISSGKCKVKSQDGDYFVYGSTGVIAATDSPAYHGDKILIARVGANAGFVHQATGDYEVSDNTLILEHGEDVDIRYLYHVLVSANLNQYAKGGGQPLITAGFLKSFEIALPTIEDQRKVAAILDKFYALVTDITGGIPAEIAARNKQYAYYRDKLLSFKEKVA